MKNGQIGISDIQHYTPPEVRGNKELAARFGVDEAFLQKKIGISQRHIAAPDQAASDLAVQAARKIFDEENVKKNDIELLLVVTQSPDYKLPHTAAIVQDRLGLKHVPSFDISLGCSGYIYGLAATKGLMTTCGYRHALLITVDLYSKIMDPDDKNAVLLFGDAAAATWISGDAQNRIGEFSLGTDGAGFDNLILKSGGSRLSQATRPDDSGNEGNEESHFLHMDGRRIFNFMMKYVPKDLETCLRRNGLHLEQIDYFVFHQASKFMIESLAKRMDLDFARVVLHLDNLGNTVSSTVPIALQHLMNNQPLQGKKVLLSGFGVGLSWGSTVLYC